MYPLAGLTRKQSHELISWYRANDIVRYQQCNAGVFNTGNGLLLYSYYTPVAFVRRDKRSENLYFVELLADWDCSRTTASQVTRWLNEVMGFSYHTVDVYSLRKLYGDDKPHYFTEYYTHYEKTVRVMPVRGLAPC